MFLGPGCFKHLIPLNALCTFADLKCENQSMKPRMIPRDFHQINTPRCCPVPRVCHVFKRFPLPGSNVSAPCPPLGEPALATLRFHFRLPSSPPPPEHPPTPNPPPSFGWSVSSAFFRRSASSIASCILSLFTSCTCTTSALIPTVCPSDLLHTALL